MQAAFNRFNVNSEELLSIHNTTLVYDNLNK